MKNSRFHLLKKIFGMGILIFVYKDSSAQPIITNGSFESSQLPPHYQQLNNVPNQPSYWDANTFATGWTSPTGGSPDLFNDGSSNSAACGNVYSLADNPGRPAFNTHPATPPICCYPQVCTSTNIFGSQTVRSHTGDPNWTQPNHQYAGIDLGKEYLQSQQFAQLTAGVTYELSFYVSRGDLAENAARIQVLLSHDNLADPNNTGVMSYSSDPTAYVLTKRHFVYDKQAWTQMIFDFTATGHERYITLGVFDVNGTPNLSTGIPDPTFEQDLLSPGDCQAGNGSNGCGPVEPNPGLTYTDQNGTHQVICANDNTTHCQVGSNVTYYYIDDVSMKATCTNFTAPLAFTNATLTGANSYSNANILLTGNVTITGNVNWTGCTVRCNGGTVIHLTSGASLHLTNSQISGGCNNLMWDGILTDYSTAVYVDSSSISDAITAINSDFSYLQVDHSSTFSRNVTDIYWHNPQSIASQHIMGTTFEHLTPLIDNTQGIGGYGIKSIEYDMSPVGFIPTIGGTNPGQGCHFIGGQWGVRASDADLIIKGSIFEHIQQVAVNYVGNNGNNALRSLSVYSCTFLTSKRDILSQHRTNLTVQYSSMNDAQEHAIEWDDNHDGHLIIGDTIDPAKGNTFQNCAWTAVTAWDNFTHYTGTILNFGLNQSNNYTSVTIANNVITAPSFATGGLLVGEWGLGSNVPYHSLNIKANTMNGIAKGIQMANISGWGGKVTFPVNYLPPPQTVHSNTIYTSTSNTATPYGIKLSNTQGYNVSENGVASDNNGNYQNNGIAFENSPNSEVYGNIVNAGTAMNLGLDMLGANVHCNWFGSYAVGFALNWTYLRDTIHLHGSNIEEYNNTLSYTSVPWNSDVNVYNSQRNHNQWVWNGAGSFLTITYAGNTGSGNLISNVTGTDKCLGPLGIVYAGSGTNTHLSFPNNVPAQWRADYMYEIQRLNTGDGDAAVASANIKSIIGIENNIDAGNYQDALTALGSLVPANNVEQNYKDVLTVFANINYPVKRDPTQAEKDALIGVAEKYARLDGAAVTSARAYLAVKYNLYFPDEVNRQGQVYGAASITSPCSLSPNSGTSLGMMDDQGNDLPIFGTTIEANGNFTFDPFQLAYYSNLNPGTKYRIYSKYGSTYTVVNKTFQTLADWITASPISLSLSGVSVAIDTTTSTPFETISHFTSKTDDLGNVYSIGISYESGSADFLLEKKDANGDLIWARTFDGAASQDDFATCMTLGDDGFVYVAGKVSNGKNFDYQTLKYDTDGYLQWASVVSDNFRADNTPTGIKVDKQDGSVHVTGTSVSDTKADYRFIKYYQCLPSSARHMNEQETSPSVQVSAIEFYPNPSSGTITVVMIGQGTGTLELFNLAGQLVLTQQLTHSGEVSLPEAQVPNGVYLLKFTGAADSQFNKLVIQRN